MKRVIIVVGSVILVVAGIGYYYYQLLESRIVRLTPEVVADLRQKTDAQNESLIPVHSAKREATAYNPLRNVYFGDLHVHTALSFDSYLFGNRNGLDEAYRFASGESLELASGEALRISRPLDFVALTDHAESFALWVICGSEGLSEDQEAFCEAFDNPSLGFFNQLRAEGGKRPPKRTQAMCPDAEACIPAEKATWQRIGEAADHYNQPGIFTAFRAYEYSPVLPETGKAHRNVIFKNSHVPDHAITTYDAHSTPALWRMLGDTCTEPCEVLTIPHNMNKMWGLAYSGMTIDGDPYGEGDWALRAITEPLAEIYQIKGASECAVGAGAVDEECGFTQSIPLCESGQTVACVSENSFAREGLKKGLQLQETLGFNPLRFGFIGSTDTHNGSPGDTEEWDFRGANGIFSSPAVKRLSAPADDFKSGIERSPGGLAAVWAEENTRDAIFEAMKRRETFATSGTRIRLRVFAGSQLPLDMANEPDSIAMAYEKGTPMGGILPEDTDRLRLVIHALQDPYSAPLQRVQVVKGWLEGGETNERVIDIACSGGLVPDA
ncbi:MAG: DUF3604 domain-containing protein, partial [Gammaproteobacteria bacterium]|nr:DUF3604 domain-containing protein [Gammaproteobacteria bacterium]